MLRPRKKDEQNAGFNVLSTLYMASVIICLILVMVWIIYTIKQGAHEDFRVFYESAKATLQGQTMYRTYGPIDLPYWYLPWLAWFYTPFALFSPNIAYLLYTAISIACAFAAVNFMAGKMKPPIIQWDVILMFSMSLLLCWLVFMVGQMDFILVAITVFIIISIERNHLILAGLVTPILLFKPHLFILFLPLAVLKGGKKFLLSSALACLLLFVIAFIIIPDWPQQMLHMLGQSGQRTDNNWNFTTLPNMLGMQENWSGTANLPITVGLVLIGFMILWNLRKLDTLPLLSLALAGSLFCAPRAYAYNLPLLLPAMIWLSADLPKPYRTLFWLGAAIVPFIFRFSSGTYLIVLVVFLWGALKAKKLVESANHETYSNMIA